jgi:hypothetical protein
MGQNVFNDRPLLEGCSGFTTYADLGSIWYDRRLSKRLCFYPSLHGLHRIAAEYPNATIVLTTREAHEWWHSCKKWHHILDRLSKNCDGFPAENSTEEDWVGFYHRHTESVRQFARDNSMTYVEVELTAKDTALRLQEQTGIAKECWADCLPHTEYCWPIS